MSQAAAVLADAAEVALGILLVPVIGPASLGISAMGMGGLIRDIGLDIATKKEEEKAKANVESFKTPTTQPTGGASSSGGVDISKPPPDVTDVTPGEIAKQRYTAAELQIGTMQRRLGQTLLGEKVSEATAEGGITASTAARGLKLSGSPLMQLIAQKQAGEQAVSYTYGQGMAAIKGAQLEVEASYKAAGLAAKENQQYVNQEISNAWLSAFGSTIETAGTLVGRFWKNTPTRVT